MSVSISTAIFGPLKADGPTFPEMLERIAAAGFRAVEISCHHRDIFSSVGPLSAFGLGVWAVHGYENARLISTSTDERRRGVDAESALMERAAAFAPCPYVLHYLNRSNSPEIGVCFRESIEALLRRAIDLGLILAIETVPYKPESDERYAPSQEVADFVRSLDSPFARVCVDLNHANLQEDLADVAAACHGIVATIHVSDNHGVREEHLFPGEGTIHFPRAIGALRAAGYSGPINLECSVRGGELPSKADLAKLYTIAVRLDEQ